MSYEIEVFNLDEFCAENGKHLQKTMHYTTECDVAVAQVSVSFFICVLGCLWLL